MWPRDLLPEERHFLDVLLSRPFEGRKELRQQALKASVTGPSCACGCPSVWLEVDRSAPPSSGTGPVADGHGLDAFGNLVGVGLLVDASGYMNELDVWAVGSDIKGQPTVTAHGRPSVASFQLAPHDGEVLNLLDLMRGRANHGKN